MSDSDSDSSCASECSSEPEFSAPAKTMSKDTVETAASLSDSDSESGDDASSSGSSSSGSFVSDHEEEVPSSDDDDDDDSSFGSDDDSDSSDDDSDDDDTPAKTAPKRTASVDSAVTPPGISEEAMKAFFSQPVDEDEDEEEKKDEQPERKRGVSRQKSAIEVETEKMILEANRQMQNRQSELSVSHHSVESCEKMLEEMSKDLDDDLSVEVDDFKVVDDISIEEEAKSAPREPKRGAMRTHSSMLRDKREMRLSKVRDRIRKQEEQKEHEEDEKRDKDLAKSICATGTMDMSEDARRERAYSWYTRMAMPSNAEMKERVETMPASSGLSVSDVDLMPWNPKGTMVNVGKMQRFINAGFKKKFTRKGAAPKEDSDSDSD